MKHALALAFAALVVGCSSGPSTPPPTSANGAAVAANAGAEVWGGPAGKIAIGGKYFTRTNLYIVDLEYITSDSWLTGEFLTMGTEVTVLETAKSDTRWKVKVTGGRELWICVGYKGVYKDAYQEIQKFLAPQDPRSSMDVPAGEIAEAIKLGKPVIGMTRAQAIGALGFPPNIADPMTTDVWRYPQRNGGYRGIGARFDRHNVGLSFTGDKVTFVDGWNP